jgi:hypothetical protein
MSSVTCQIRACTSSAILLLVLLSGVLPHRSRSQPVGGGGSGACGRGSKDDITKGLAWHGAHHARAHTHPTPHDPHTTHPPLPMQPSTSSSPPCQRLFIRLALASRLFQEPRSISQLLRGCGCVCCARGYWGALAPRGHRGGVRARSELCVCVCVCVD